ncbi:hypothetical protein NU219Hw_g6678t1 [Hortaea werneckii]
MYGEDNDSQVQPRSYRQVDSSLSDVLRESIEERARCLEVRKFCQVKPSLVQYGRHPKRHSNSSGQSVDLDQGDAALTALLRCVVYELEADLAMISLLDDENQYFIAGASRGALGSAQVTAESARWYGCDSVLHHGGLCERTVTIPHLPAVYEELDLAANPSTSRLPFVDGTVASFRHYAGAPLVTPTGIVVGTVFTFSNKASSGLSQHRRKFLVDTSQNVMAQLLQALQALDGTRASMFNTAIASLLSATNSFIHCFDQDPSKFHRQAQRAGEHHSPFVLNIYQRAAELVVSTFELDWCAFRELGSPGNHGNSLLSKYPRSSGTELDASLCSVFSTSMMQDLTRQFPNGAIFHWSGISDDGVFVVAAGQASRALRSDISASIRQSFLEAQQVMFMPLWDSLHNRTAAVALCHSKSFDRVYASHTDLTQLAAFCTSAITQVLRMEGHLLDRTKADFLGSISHEMRSPLHTTLASLELLEETAHSDHQRNLVESAQSGGKQMLDTINKILQFTNIDPLQFQDSSRPARPGFNERHDSATGFPDELQLLRFCEEIVGKVLDSTETMDIALPLRNEDGKVVQTHPPVITLDAWPEDCTIRLRNHNAFRVIFANLFANAIKYSGVDCCLQVRLMVGEENMTLKITDCGKGIPQDFRWNSLYVPFSQANPIDPGTGLGLALVKRTLDALHGTIHIESDMSIGTIVSVLIPTASLADEPFADRAPVTRRVDLNFVPSPLQAQLFVPPAWSSGIYGTRGDRLVDNLFSSLERGLKGWVSSELTSWDPRSPSPLPHVVFVRHSDLEAFEEACGATHADVRKVVIGRRKRSNFPPVHLYEPLANGVARVVEIEGPLLPSLLEKAIDLAFEAPEAPDNLFNKTAGLRLENESSQQTAEREAEPQNPRVSADRDKQSVDSATTSATEMSTDPRILLVDDNSINLKLLRMFVQKCGISQHTSAGGGQEAIDAFDTARQEDDNYFMCFMDLSMPDVDGFQATAAIRQRESNLRLPKHQRMIIIALTGLVSAKDRHAAAQAGVDDFLTKPADFKTIQKCLDYWKAERSDLASSGAVAG